MYFPPECFGESAETGWLLKPGTWGRVSWWLFGPWDAQRRSAGSQSVFHLLPGKAARGVEKGVAAAAAAATPGFQLLHMFSCASEAPYG